MAAYLVIDVDDLVRRFRTRGIKIDLQELAVSLRGNAALAAGLVNVDKLKAIAVADWPQHHEESAVDLQYVFKAAGYEIFNIPQRESVTDALIIHYFSYDPEPVSELILVTTSRDLIPLVRRVKMTRNARLRVWGSEDVLQGTEFAEDVIFQPLESLLGLQSRNVAVFIDFENISISLNEQGFMVNLDQLISSFVSRAKAHGHVVKMAAYAPWGQRGTLPPLVDSSGREIAEEAPSRLALANIDPVYNLPGKNSADVRIARDVMTDVNHDDAGDVFILASGDRDFNDVVNALLSKNKTVILWGVRGSTSRQLENHPGITVEYIDDFSRLQTHQSLSKSALVEESAESFTPSQWSSVVVQYDRLAQEYSVDQVSIRRLIDQLQNVGAVISQQRGDDLISQAISLGILKVVSNGYVTANGGHPVVDKTRLVRDRIVTRVDNTLQVRGWEYVNYGFLLKGLAMDRQLDRPGCNIDDQWRSHWIDALVREQVLERELIPHRHNPEDLVPVIKLSTSQINIRSTAEIQQLSEAETKEEARIDNLWLSTSLEELEQMEPQTVDMIRRIVVSVEQFTSFRGFAWCPLGSLHRRLNGFDNGISFQRAVEYLVENNAAYVEEYPNPQSSYNTKGISLNNDDLLVKRILTLRDSFIHVLLTLYSKDLLISRQSFLLEDGSNAWDLDLWFSIMETENVLNALPGRPGQYSLFRTHHTVNLVAGAEENATPRDQQPESTD
ncbi:MAG: NYN domain-containing protein [Anaerolineae bacterium]|jgi:hypothetical protein|nr:NYN domain-containing protein [Anaerolineae bacterium]